MSPSAPLDWQFLRFSLFGWQFWEVLVRYFVECPSIGICLVFLSWLGLRGLGEEDHRGKVSFLPHHGLSLWMLTLKQCLSGLSLWSCSGTFRVPHRQGSLWPWVAVWGGRKSTELCYLSSLVPHSPAPPGPSGEKQGGWWGLFDSIYFMQLWGKDDLGTRYEKIWKGSQEARVANLSLGLEILLSQSPIC